MAEPTDEGRRYPNPHVETAIVEGYPLVFAQVSDLPGGRYPREHRRILGGEGTDFAGRALIYSDTYVSAPGDPIFAYARHDADRAEFFERLDEFLTGVILIDSPELRDHKAQCVFQTRDELQEVNFDSYLHAAGALVSRPVVFARLYFPFGDMTVNFGPASTVSDELETISNGALTAQLEAPLFAFDASQSDVWITFLTAIHWARNQIAPEVLRTIITMGARAYA
jgi:hypothetical protein